MKPHALAVLIGLALFAGPAIQAQPEPLSVYVDCDAGDDLSRLVEDPALAALARDCADLARDRAIASTAKAARGLSPDRATLNGTPPEWFAALSARLKRWRSDQGPRWIETAERARVERAWRELRTLGDRLFAASTADAKTAQSSLLAIVLVESEFRRGTVARKLRAAGFEVEAAANPEAVRGRLARGPEVAAVFSDDVEPSRHLRKLVRLGVCPPGVSGARLILVTATRVATERDARGVAGVWTAPYAPRDLAAMFASS
jgi:hypothetical protein